MSRAELTGNDACVIQSCKAGQVVVKDRPNTTRSYYYDAVFDGYSKQTEIFENLIDPMIKDVVDGYNCTVFAYGQTGTGKTFTMTGERSDPEHYSWERDPRVGIIPRALGKIFDRVTTQNVEFAVKLSFLEIYNEELYDLLGEKHVRLNVYDDASKKGSVLVKGLSEVLVQDKEEVFKVIEQGLARRVTAATAMNAQSSRSHAIFTVNLHLKDLDEKGGDERLRIGKFNLVDLAGSECVGKTQVVDKRLREASSINQSLLTLRRVICSLVDHTSHIPYRESKLTRILQDSLGGRTKTVIIATISPASSNLDETLSTLDYAHRAKNITNKPEVNQILSKKGVLKSYNEAIQQMQRDLEAARSKNGFFIDEANYQALLAQREEQRELICQLEDRRQSIEAQLEGLTHDFTLAKEERDNLQCQNDSLDRAINELRLDLRSSRAQLHETNEIRRAHRLTEIQLQNQSNQLRAAVRSSASDVDKLHEKLANVVDLNRRNKENMLGYLPGKFSEQLKPPMNGLEDLTERISAKVAAVSHQMKEVQCGIATACSERSSEMSQLLSQLAESLRSRDRCFLEQLTNFTRSQADTASMLTSQFAQTNTALLDEVERLSEESKQFHGQIMDKIQSVDEMMTTLVELFEELRKVTSECAADVNKAVELQKTDSYYSEKLRTQLDYLDSLRESLEEQHEVRQNHASEQQAINSRLLQHLGKSEPIYVQGAELTSNAFGASRSMQDLTNAMLRTQKASGEATLNQLSHTSSLVNETSSKLDELRQRSLTEGLIQFLESRARDWTSVNDKSSELEEVTQLQGLSRTSSAVLCKLNSDVSALLTKLHESVDEIRPVSASAADILKREISILPEILKTETTELFAESLSAGDTPHRRKVSEYPGYISTPEMAKTRPYRKILEEIRRDRNSKEESHQQNDAMNTTFEYSMLHDCEDEGPSDTHIRISLDFNSPRIASRFKNVQSIWEENENV